MKQAAVPAYLGNNFLHTPPGHRFGMYFQCWKPGSWERTKDARKTALEGCCKLNDADLSHIDVLLTRQQAIANNLGNPVWSHHTRSTAPLVTGLGMEHPSENGFAFLNPWGLPYLPGSSVKGVLRNSAERLALGLEGQDPGGWDMLAVWMLFGFDSTSPCLTRPDETRPDLPADEARWWRSRYIEWIDSGKWSPAMAGALANRLGVNPSWQDRPAEFLHALTGAAPEETLPIKSAELALAGALRFWDVIIRPPGRPLAVEILTPHYSNYYQGNATPHESGQPTPNPFLVVPPDSELTFNVQCDTSHLPEPLKQTWSELLESAFSETLEWSGFGAKTALGYGVLEHDQSLADKARERQAEQVRAQRHAELSAEELAIEDVATRLAQERQSGNNSGPSGDLARMRNELLANSAAWESPDLRHRAGQVIRDTVAWIAWPKKKRADRNAELRRLLGDDG